MIKRTFKPGYKALDPEVQTEVRDRLMNACFWSRPGQNFKGLNNFYRKMRGDTKITELEVREIEKVFNEYKLDPWTDQ